MILSLAFIIGVFFEVELKRLNAERQLPLSVIMGDINGLKLINDVFGHVEGDKLLAEVARMLKQVCRQEDILARTGGDEFCLLLPQTGPVEVKRIHDRIVESFGKSEENKETDIPYLSISFGYATRTSLHESVESTFKVAEDLMYRRKILERKSLHSSVMCSIRATLFEKSHETEEHAQRLVDLSKQVGIILGLSDRELDELELASALHDIGKMSVDQRILLKPGDLTTDEWEQIKKHPEAGCRIAMSCMELNHIAEYILSHHERWDGKGYPQGLVGEDIPLLSRIIAVVDAYDAMTQDRPYRKTLSAEEAMAEVMRNAGTQFDPQVARVLIQVISQSVH